MLAAPHDIWEHARRLIPGRVLRLAFASAADARAFRARLYRARRAAREISYAEADAAFWGRSPWDALEITLAPPNVDGEAFELRIARTPGAHRDGPVEISVGSL